VLKFSGAKFNAIIRIQDGLDELSASDLPPDSEEALTTLLILPPEDDFGIPENTLNFESNETTHILTVAYHGELAIKRRGRATGYKGAKHFAAEIAERKGWAAEAYAYNSLVVAWPDVQSKATELQAQQRIGKHMNLFDMEVGK
jgi:hypothetical protein